MSPRRLATICVVALALASATAFTQALPNLSSLRVEYNTRKATVKPEGELKVQIDQIDREIAEAVRLGRGGEVRRLLAKGMTLLGGTPWTDISEFQAALTIRTDRLIIDSSVPYRVRLEQIFAPAIELTRPLRAHATLRVRVPPPLGLDGMPLTTASASARPGVVQNRSQQTSTTSSPIELGTFDGVGRDLRESPFKIDLNVATVPDGAYTLAIEVRDQDRLLGRATLPVAIHKGLDARLRALESAASKAPDTTQADLRYLGDVVRKINDGVVSFGTFELEPELAATETVAAAVAKTKKDPFVGRTGDFERHYLLQDANEIMPYRLLVPASYDGARAFPLIIALHGLGGTEDAFFDSYGKRLPALAAERGYIVAAPLGFRVDSFYGASIGLSLAAAAERQAQLGEQDVMEVLRRMRADYKIDDARIYLMGHSMGAIGTWALAAKYPDIWAAIAPFAGFARPATADRMKAIPQFVVHGDADTTVPVAGSRTIVAALEKIGTEVTYVEVPGGTHRDVVVPNLAAMFDFFDRHRKTKEPSR